MLSGSGSLGIAFCHEETTASHYIYVYIYIYTEPLVGDRWRKPTRLGRRLLSRSYFSSSNYILLKRRKNLKSPLKRNRFSSPPQLSLSFYLFSLFVAGPIRSLYPQFFLASVLSPSLSRVLSIVSRFTWRLRGCHPYQLIFSFSLPPSHLLPISVLNRSTSRQASKAFQMKALSVISFPSIRIAPGPPFPPRCLLFSFFRTTPLLRHCRSYLPPPLCSV